MVGFTVSCCLVALIYITVTIEEIRKATERLITAVNESHSQADGRWRRA